MIGFFFTPRRFPVASKSEGTKGKAMPFGKSAAPSATKVKGEKVPAAAKAKGMGGKGSMKGDCK